MKKIKTNVFGDAAIEYMKKNPPMTIITRGDLNGMHGIFEMAVEKGAKGRPSHAIAAFYDHKRVLDALERDERFEKGYICYNGIINRPTRSFTLKTEYQYMLEN